MQGRRNRLIKEIRLESDEKPQQVNLDEGHLILETPNRTYAKLQQDKKGRVYIEDLTGEGGFIRREEKRDGFLVKNRYRFSPGETSDYLKNGDEIIMGSQEKRKDNHYFYYFEREKPEE